MTLKRLLKEIAMSLFCLLFTLSLFAQTKVISGKITDAKDGSGVSGVSVTVRGTKTGTQTGPDGSFQLTVPQNATTLVASYVGYESQEITITDKTSVDVALTAQTSALNEVVVVGYGTARRKDVTGAVTKVTASEFNTGVISNPLQQVQGKVAGLVIVQPGSDPNSNVTVRLRGATSLEGQPPLLVIDGVAIDDFNRGLNSLAPNDIESYDILRDASSAAIYGSRGPMALLLLPPKKAVQEELRLIILLMALSKKYQTV